jgi:hypothetical protein
LISGIKSRTQTEGYLSRIFGPKTDEVTGGWRKLHNKELHNVYSLSNIIRMMKYKEDEMGR